MTTTVASGPVVFAYDGSDLAQFAIDEAGRLLPPGGEALVVCVWRPIDVGFQPVGGSRLNPDHVADVKRAAEETAAAGAARAEGAGFRAHGIAVEATPTWRGVTSLADDRDARLSVLGSHGRTRPVDALLGSVARATGEHSGRAVLIVHHHR